MLPRQLVSLFRASEKFAEIIPGLFLSSSFSNDQLKQVNRSVSPDRSLKLMISVNKYDNKEFTEQEIAQQFLSITDFDAAKNVLFIMHDTLYHQRNAVYVDSVFLCAVYIAAFRGYSLDDAVKIIDEKYKKINLSEAMLEQANALLRFIRRSPEYPASVHVPSLTMTYYENPVSFWQRYKKPIIVASIATMGIATLVVSKL